MNVFILGGDRRHYLPLQLEAIRENVIDLDDVVYVQGPFHEHSLLAPARQPHAVTGLYNRVINNWDVSPKLKHWRLPETVACVLKKFHAGKSLILHGDCWPILPVSAESILGEKHAQWSNSPSLCWSCFRGFSQQLSGNWWRDLEGRAPGCGAIPRREFFPIGFGWPGFIHADDLSTDHESVIAQKVILLKRMMTEGFWL